MNFVLVTEDVKIVEAAKIAYGKNFGLKVFKSWEAALDACKEADLIFVDMLATLTDPGKIEGYEKFAAAKMSHGDAYKTPLVVIAPPTGYDLDAMVGWPNFLHAMVRRPVTERLFRQAIGWV